MLCIFTKIYVAKNNDFYLFIVVEAKIFKIIAQFIYRYVICIGSSIFSTQSLNILLFPFTYRPTALHANKKVVHVVSQQEFKAEDLPDLNCQEVAKAAVQIQKVYRGFQTRKQIKQSNDDLPDLKSKDVADAAVKIQAVYRYKIV